MPEVESSRAIQAEVATALGQVSLVSERWHTPFEHEGWTEEHRLQLSLLQFRDNGTCCFPEAWGSKRFDPIGQMFLLPARQIVHARSNCPEQKSIVYNFGIPALERWFDRDIEWSVAQLERSLAIADPEIRRLMMRIGQELRDPGFASAELIELMTAEIIIALSRLLRKLDDGPAKGGLAPWRLRLIDDYLEAHPTGASLTDLAKACRLSVRQLSRAFHLSRGCSIGTYIANRRMEEARRRLALGSPIKTVAIDMGFSSTSSFSAAFRRTTGEGPSFYQMRGTNGYRHFIRTAADGETTQ